MKKTIYAYITIAALAALTLSALAIENSDKIANNVAATNAKSFTIDHSSTISGADISSYYATIAYDQTIDATKGTFCSVSASLNGNSQQNIALNGSDYYIQLSTKSTASTVKLSYLTFAVSGITSVSYNITGTESTYQNSTFSIKVLNGSTTLAESNTISSSGTLSVASGVSTAVTIEMGCYELFSIHSLTFNYNCGR
jgi:hypothetical protein